MKRVILIFVGLICVNTATIATEVADRDTTRTLIVARLLNQIAWPAQKQPDQFTLCTYKNIKAFRSFSRTLRGFRIADSPITVSNIADYAKAKNCDAVFLVEPSDNIIERFVKNSTSHGAVMVAQGKGYADKGVHLNLYLNKEGNFEFEINPDSFILSLHTPTQALLELGRLVDNKADDEASLMRYLINFTEWPEAEISLKENERFQLCAFENNVFAAFANHFLSGKRLKGKALSLRVLNSEQVPETCQALLLDNNDRNRLITLMPQRDKMDTLLVGRAPELAEKGVHYNLNSNFSSGQRRFDINLFAFELSGHLPDFGLLNSANVVKIDYPILSQRLTEIAQNIVWPEGYSLNDTPSGRKEKRPISLCVVGKTDDIEQLSFFAGASLATREAQFSLSQNNSDNGYCDLIYFDNASTPDILQIINNRQYEHAVYISSQQHPDKLPTDFNLLIDSRNILLQLNHKIIKKHGLSLKKRLLDSASILRGDTHD